MTDDGRPEPSVDQDRFLELIMDTCSKCGALVKIQSLVWDLRAESWKPLVLCDAGHEEVQG